ncbi:MAG: recombination mediator RecR [Planctomycetota bacterium]
MAGERLLGELIDAFSTLPGIGQKSAERLAYHVLKMSRSEAMQIAEAIRRVKDDLRRCTLCQNISEEEICTICSDESRERNRICVIEQPKDLRAIEESGSYQGLYHVLGASFSPLEERGSEQMSLDKLVERSRSDEVEEVILATNPDFEGDGTALLVTESLAETGVHVTRLARGLPTGGQIEYMNRSILKDAVEGRSSFETAQEEE